jgi:hypothetical protein
LLRVFTEASRRSSLKQPGISHAPSLLCSITGFGKQTQQLRAHHFLQHAGWHGVWHVVVANVNVEPVHHIEMRVGEELFDCGVANFAGHPGLHEGLKVRLGCQEAGLLDGGQRRCFRGLMLDFGLCLSGRNWGLALCV